MPRSVSVRTLLWFGLPALLLAASFGAAAGAVRLIQADGDRIKILGSGDGVAILITTGQTDLLIATGTDRTAFGNAYDRVSIGPGSRPDIVLVAGSGHSLNVPISAIELFPDADAFALHPMETGAAGDTNLAAVPQIPRNPIRFTLDGQLVVIVESLPTGDDGTFAWRAIITRDTSRIGVISSLEHADAFTWSDSVSALVVAGDAAGADGGPINTTAIIGPADSLEPPVKATSLGSTGHDVGNVVPVRPGSVATATFVDSGIELTSDDLMYDSGRAG